MPANFSIAETSTKARLRLDLQMKILTGKEFGVILI